MPYGSVAFVTELRRWDNEFGNNDKVTQWGVVIEQNGTWIHVPFGHFLGKLLGTSPAATLAGILDVRHKRTTLSSDESKAADAAPSVS